MLLANNPVRWVFIFCYLSFSFLFFSRLFYFYSAGLILNFFSFTFRIRAWRECHQSDVILNRQLGLKTGVTLLSCADSIQFCCCLLLKWQLFLSIELSISVRFALLMFKIVSNNGDCLVCKCFRAIIFGSFFLLAFDRLAHSNKMVNLWFHSKIENQQWMCLKNWLQIDWRSFH